MKEKVWLSRTKHRSHWHYGLGRYADGSIRVSEILYHDGFTPVGTSNTGEAERLYPHAKSLIAADLFVACAKELDIPITDETLKRLKEVRVKAFGKDENEN